MDTKTINILVVDDKEANRLTVIELLRDNSDFQISFFEAKNGEEALSTSMEEDIHLIILDIQMPGMDGFEVAKYLKSTNKTKHIPIIFLTAVFKSGEFQLKGFDLGAVDYMTKPIDENQFINRVNLYLKLFQKEQELKQYQTRLEDMVKEQMKIIENRYVSDDLTELYNKVYLKDKMKKAQDISSILLLNMDNFGMINSNYGYDMGDSLLIQIALSLEEFCDEDMTLCRLDGDEFVFFQEGEHKDKFYEIAKKIKKYFMKHKLKVSEGIEFHVSFTMGIDSGKDENLLKNVTLSINEIREVGKNHIKVFNPNSEFEKIQKTNLYWIEKIPYLLENDALQPYFQAIQDINTKQI